MIDCRKSGILSRKLTNLPYLANLSTLLLNSTMTAGRYAPFSIAHISPTPNMSKSHLSAKRNSEKEREIEKRRGGLSGQASHRGVT